MTHSTPDTIMMHDLVHDLAQSIMENKVPAVQVERQVTSTSNTKIRQVNLRKKLVAFPTSTQHDMDISYILTKFSCLRVLDASGARIKDLPSMVGDLKHLRFLNLSRSEVRTLPNSLCSLLNLQTLNLDNCLELVALPRNMRYLKNLRHFFMEACESLRGMPSKIRELTCLKTLSLFIVGSERGNQLEELQCLNLGGRLEIKHLERVGSYMDAKKANLAEKKDLRRLGLIWQSNVASTSRADIDEKVLEALQPHPNFESLRIRGFNGRYFPVWMADSVLKKVVRMSIVDCPHCLHLPQLGKLPNLAMLKLEKLEVEYMIEDENAVDTLFPSLKTHELCYLPHLKGVSKEQVSTKVLPNLGRIRIDSCPLIILPQLSSLQELDIQNCDGLMLTSFPKLDALTFLRVGFGENMKSIPMETLEKLTNLESLTVDGAEEQSVPEEGLQALKSLTKLWIQSSETLTCLPVGWLRHLTALSSVRLYDCLELVDLPEEIKDLNNLETLELVKVAKMVCLPKAIRHLSSLKSLTIWALPLLNSLPNWLNDLSSLTALQIYNCPKLVSLPASIRGIPNLQSLSINDCPELERRCKRGTGEEWHNISHIPNLYINP